MALAYMEEMMGMYVLMLLAGYGFMSLLVDAVRYRRSRKRLGRGIPHCECGHPRYAHNPKPDAPLVWNSCKRCECGRYKHHREAIDSPLQAKVLPFRRHSDGKTYADYQG